MTKSLGPMSLVGLVLLGIALLWVTRLAYGRRRARSDDALRLVLNIAAWVMVIVGITGACVQVLPVGVVIVLGILAMAVSRYRAVERRSLLWMLSGAARRGIPLDEAAMAFAMERPDELGLRAERLADLLRSGVALPEALQRSRTRLPMDAQLAVRLGTETGNLSGSMQHVAQLDGDLDSLIRSMFEKCFYLAVLMAVLTGVLSFMMLQIVPVFAKMFDDFGLELPAATQMVISGSAWFVQFWFLSLPLLLALLLSLLLGALYYVDLLPRSFPVLNWLSRRVDGAYVMRVLSLAVEQSWAIDKTIEMLARIYPKRSVARRLQTAGQRINQGRDWSDSLRSVGLIRNSDAVVFKAAQRAGNLQWGLQEMADSSLRRLAYWLRFWLSVLFPVVLLITGILIAVISVGLFLPLISLIQGLS